MQTFLALTKRNIKLFFKDKGLLFTSLITPIILLVLYVTFLANVYKDTFISNLPDGLEIKESIINGTVSGELISSLLAVCCITVAFCANTLMASDKVKKVVNDLSVTPLPKHTLALSYFFATLVTTLIMTYTATIAGFIYIACTGWFLSVGDVFLIILDVFLLTTFGTAFSSIINTFLTSQGQVSGIGTIVSAGYGFICGAYMPISSFSPALQKVLMFLPGTYGTALTRNHFLNGVFNEMESAGFPSNVVETIKNSIDCNIYFFNNQVSILAMYIVLIIATIALVGAYVLVNVLRKNKGK